MKSKNKRNSVPNLKSFYEQRIKRLQEIKLDDVLAWNPRSVGLLGDNCASAIVVQMIENYLASSELELNDLVTNAEFCIELIRQKDELKKIRWEYETQFAHAQNIITHEFCERFLTRTHNVNWKKLLRFSGGKQPQALAKT